MTTASLLTTSSIAARFANVCGDRGSTRQRAFQKTTSPPANHAAHAANAQQFDRRSTLAARCLVVAGRLRGGNATLL
eukprot:11203831-Lingulodinium_polyedra.AAC.1